MQARRESERERLLLRGRHEALAALTLGALALAGCVFGDDKGPPDPDGKSEPVEPGAPVILSGPTVTTTATSAVVRWTTDQPSRGAVAARGPTDAATDSPRLTTDHRLPLFNLRPASSYAFTVQTWDPADPGRFSEASDIFVTAAARPNVRVLFDGAHGQNASEADWLIDDDAGSPSPAAPANEASWSGSYSAFAYALHASGRFDVVSLGAGGRFSYQDGGNPYDLSKFDVLVLPEPNSWTFPNPPECGAECLAVVAFVYAGGGLLAIANHPSSDRDSDGLDSPKILNRIFEQGGVGLSVDIAKGTMPNPTPCSSSSDLDPIAPVVRGPFGDARCLEFFSGGALLASPGQNATARHVFWYPGASGNTFGMAGIAELESGRVVLVGDSAAAADGTASSGKTAGAGTAWPRADRGNAALFLNAVSWLAGEY